MRLNIQCIAREMKVVYSTRKKTKCKKKLNKSLATSPECIVKMFSFLENESVEYFYVLHLNIKLEILSYEMITKGTLDSTYIKNREVFKGAVLANSANIVCIHNHPSGDINPSAADRDITERLVKAGDIIGIPVVDHIIIGLGGDYYSFKEAGGF